MTAPNLESFRRGSMFDASFRRSNMFDGSFRQSFRDYSYMFEDNTPARCCSYMYLVKKSKGVLVRAWEMGTSDPRKIIFSAKMGLALTLISLLVFFKLPGSEVSNHYLWAILTIIVIFEFSIGGTFSKGCHVGLGTLSAGALALGTAEISDMTGKCADVFNTASIFVVAFLGTYAKLYPTMKPYEYGFRVFLLTYCYVIVSGYRSGEFMETAVSRLLMIALGASIGLIVNICIYPIWAGDDLHNLITNNFVNVATSLEGCVNGYLNSAHYDLISVVDTGYRSAVESKSQEDTLMGFAAWEPPHGPYRSFRYPWKMYVKVGGALRHCAFMVMALHGCILSQIQAPEEKREAFRNELQKVGLEGAKVLRLIGQKLKKMERLNPIEDILEEIHQAAEQLQSKIDKKSYLLVNVENWEIGNDGIEVSNIDEEGLISRKLDYESHKEAALLPRQTWWPPFLLSISSIMWKSESADLSLATFASLLIEFAARLENLVNAYDELCDIANFKEAFSG
ncbi:unnamed protein product [Eruca vesicaria subsp. sativa]|uniref:Aluminum-activated malate transporter 9 n=1 Tax=Eruca vesicaria subsp. sativa TaxID=29727 RepID=A0ABC8M4I5_ERUVS|nr:unnamed protein product [Eruca vesicaria subsp. sativa]